jgi:hyperosmotically inducible periplasmic protein
MKTIKILKLTGIALVVAVVLASCENSKPAETVGKNIDRGADQVGKKIGATAEKVGDTIGDQGSKVIVGFDDTEITAKIKAAFLAESGLKTLQISVKTVQGVVTLSGSVDSQSHSDLATAMANAVSGVKKVNNHLVI